MINKIKKVSPYKVCILAAGAGTRNSFSKNIHKALLPINYQTIISRIIDYYPKNISFVVAVSHKAKLISDYLKIVKPNHKITFVTVRKSKGYGSGPGRSLLECEKFLQSPFIFHSCDTIIQHGTIPGPTYNWVGYDFTDVKKEYVSINKKNSLTNFFVVTKNNSKAFIGISGIKDYKLFWDSLKKENYYSKLINKKQKKIFFEKQTIDGFKFLENNLAMVKFAWLDTGNDESYMKTKEILEKNKKKYPLQKDEFLYFENKKVIKLFSKFNSAKNKFKRAYFIKLFLPKNIGFFGNYLYYDYTKGVPLLNIKDIKIFNYISNSLFKKFWFKKKLTNKRKLHFNRQCLLFYKDKTKKRVDDFLNKYQYIDSIKTINGEKVPSINYLLKNINWKLLSQGIPVNFHGDTAINNIISESKKKFTLIDWRESFGNIKSYGDVYYDLSKIYHTLSVSHIHLEKKLYYLRVNKNLKVDLYLKRIQHIYKFQKIFTKQISEFNYDLKKVKIISWLILLNSAPLHSNKENAIIYFLLGKIYLNQELKNSQFKLK